MRDIRSAFWGILVVLALLWLIVEPTVFQSATFFALRAAMMRLTGVIAIGSMSVAMVLALRPRLPERWLGGLDKASEGAHPYTIASNWHPEHPRINFITKELGDHTGRLREKLKVGQDVRVEEPCGCFTFDDNCPQQIWVGGGIGITPFITRMKHLATQEVEPDWPLHQTAHLFHSTACEDMRDFAALCCPVNELPSRIFAMR